MPFQVSSAARSTIISLNSNDGEVVCTIHTELKTIQATINFFNRVDRPRIFIKRFSRENLATEYSLKELLGNPV
jgi:hypothetical protein